MICPKCQSNISDKRKRCDRCGTDLTLYKKIFWASNQYYNNGLAKARVRDLSGAVEALRNSLELNKLNTDARNLLGLVYFEMGETVAAISEWVISKHFNPTGNDADDYINAVQSNPTKLDALNQAIKRYNTALSYSKQGSDDLAIIQLKKVTTLNPHFIRAYQLLALLYMKSGDNERAKKCLFKAGKIDVSNTTTLRYMRELEPPTAAVAKDAEGGTDTEKSLTNSIMPISSYKEDKPNIMAFVNLVIGVIIGLAVMAILVIPSLKKNMTAGENQDFVDNSAGLATLEEKENTISALEQDKQELEQKVEQLQTQIDGIVIPEVNSELYDPLFSAAQLYTDELAKKESDRDLKGIADTLLAIDTTQYESEVALQLLTYLKDAIFPTVAQQYYEDGKTLYNDSKYDEALVILLKSYSLDSTNANTIYFVGRSYHRLEDYESAKLYYNMITADHKESNRYSEALDRLAELPTQE